MPDATALSLSGALVQADQMQTALANSVLRLFKAGFNPTPTNVLADFVAYECDYDGYAALTITAWQSPVLAGTGYMTFAPAQIFRWTSAGTDVGNSVGGMFLVTSGGELITYTTFDPQIPMTGPGMSVIKTPVIVYPAG